MTDVGRVHVGETAVVARAHVADWRDALRLAGDALVRAGATTADYTDEMIAAVEELGPYIVIAPGIAIGHSRPSPAVLSTGLSIVTLATPVEFGNKANDPVSLVIGLAATDHDGHLGTMSALATVLSDEQAVTDLIAAPDAESIVQIFSRVADATG
ncbi:PTS system ascorbate-specific IIA component [Diaminobutyricimonas aerilata]|uniref:Ascorbate-specific PTS system EIIA component n=1 Tax=Diaminobutyricimonas aerilata TaxID=1162967 RepID=A0A2M9CJF7_9MICO|nr:PTS sugar transporter subunit IIA [Diaminobutyricimonas aerilata]PJJ72030.1 PTS system ascorbate-specific IIA component [Diaminobutyricimonas aerilata]